MKTIEERAKAYADDKLCEECINVALNPCGCFRHTRMIDEYIKIATEQQESDIQRAVEWLKNNAERYIFETTPKCGSYGDILTCIDNRMYDDFKQAMKGE